MEKVGIILVNYNGANDTIECIESIKKIKYDNYDIIVVDNASNDNSVQMLSSINQSNYSLIKSETNSGFSGGNNIGMKYAKQLGCEYILLLNNDTLVDADFLNELVDCENRHGGNVAVTGKIYCASSDKMIWYAGGAYNSITSKTSHFGIHEIDSGKYNEEIEVGFISGCCLLMPIGIVDRVGMMDEDFFLYCEDLDYCCKLRANSVGMIYTPKAIIYHKISSSTQKVPNLTTYYIARNKRIIIRRYQSGLRYVISKIYNYAEESKRIITNEYSYKAIKKARKDFKNGIIGRVNL